MSNNNNIKQYGGLMTALAVVGILVFFILANAFVTIGAGERGIVLRFGAVQELVLNEGLHFKIPLVERVVKMDVKIQKSQTDSEASTKDLQDTKFSIVVNHHTSPGKVNRIYQTIGLAYKNRIIDPSVQEVVKAVAAKYTAEELIVQRDKVSKEVKEQLYNRLKTYDIVVDDFSIVNFSFSAQFTQAIEEKQTAEQKALKAQRDLERVRYEAKQQVEQARAEAESLRLKGKEVSEELISLRKIEAQLKAIEKWNGTLPRVTSGAVPFLNIQQDK